jgi:hypothetical protein
MFNPFTEVAWDAKLVEKARNGDRAALENLALRHQGSRRWRSSREGWYQGHGDCSLTSP